MKKTPLIIVLCFIGLSTFAQDTTKVKQHLNEFSTDVTGFLKEYLNFNSSSVPPGDNYYLGYRRHFKCGNLRIGIGGDFANNQLAPASVMDSNKYYDRSYSIYLIIGWEFYDNLSKHWQVFYGLDFRPSIVYDKDDAEYWNGGFANGIETKTQIYGIAPFMGFRYKLTKRLSILTETSYAFKYEIDNTRTFYTPITTGYTPPPTINQRLTKTYTTFSQPLAIFLDFTI